MDPDQILRVVREITVSGLMAVGVWAFATGRAVTRFHYDEMRAEMQDRVDYLERRLEHYRNGPAQDKD